MWGYDYSVLSRMFNAVVDWIDNNHKHRLRQLPLISDKFEHFNRCIVNKLRSIYPGGGLAANPPEAEHCALFGDGCRFEVSIFVVYLVF